MAKEAMQNVIGGKKLRFSFSGYSFKGRELSPIWIIQWNCVTLQCDTSPAVWWYAKKDTIYAWIVYRWIVYHELVQPLLNQFFMNSI